MQIKSISLMLVASTLLVATAGLVAAGKDPLINPNIRDGGGIGVVARIVTYAAREAGFSKNQSLGTGVLITGLGLVGTSYGSNCIPAIAMKTLSAIVTFAGTTFIWPVKQDETAEAKKEDKHTPVNFSEASRHHHLSDYRK